MRHVCLTGTLICLVSNLVFALIHLGASESSSPPKRVVVLGDSLTAGYGIAKSDAYPALLQRRMDPTERTWKVANGGRSGDTTKNGLARLRWLLKQQTDILVIALGGNDGLRGLPVESMEANLKAMVSLAREKWPEVEIRS